MAYCTKCGRQINDDSGFCDSCRPVSVTTEKPSNKTALTTLIVAIVIVGAVVFMAVAIHNYRQTMREMSYRAARSASASRSAERDSLVRNAISAIDATGR